VPPRYAYSSVEALAGLLFGIFIPILFRELPKVKRNSSTVHLVLLRVLNDVGGGPEASHPAQTVVFTHTGESAEKIQLVFSTITILVS
jgi:hypothetical protein